MGKLARSTRLARHRRRRGRLEKISTSGVRTVENDLYQDRVQHCPCLQRLENGKIRYFEIPTTDIARSADFYNKVSGWDIRKRGDGATAFDDGVEQVSGAWVPARPSSPQPGLLI